jgi:hypothetical protein
MAEAVAFSQALSILFTGLGNAFKLLFAGDIGGFLAALIVPELIQVVGTFFVIYFLMHWIIVKTIIKDQEHRKAANGIALGFAFIGIVQDSIFGIISGLFGSGFVIMFVVLIVFILINLFTIARTSTAKNRADLNQEIGGLYQNRSQKMQAISGYKTAKHDKKKVGRDIRRENRLLRRERNNISAAQRDIEGTWWRGLMGDDGSISAIKHAEEEIEAMIKTVSKINSLGSQGATAKRKEQLFKESAQLPALIGKIQKKATQIEQLLSATEHLELDEFQIQSDEVKTEEHIKGILKQKLQDANLQRNNAPVTNAEIGRELKDDTRLQELAQHAHQDLAHRQQLLKSTEQFDMDAVNRLRGIHSLAIAAQNALSQGNGQSALSNLTQALQQLRAVQLDEERLDELLKAWEVQEKNAEILDNKMKQLLKDLSDSLEGQTVAIKNASSHPTNNFQTSRRP